MTPEQLHGITKQEPMGVIDSNRFTGLLDSTKAVIGDFSEEFRNLLSSGSRNMLIGGLGVLAATGGIAAATAGGYAKKRSAEAEISQNPRVYLSGQFSNLQYYKPYTYNLEFVTDKSYKNAVLRIDSPPANYATRQVINIKAHKPFEEKFTLTYSSPVEISTGIGVALFTHPTRTQINRHLFGNLYALSLPPNLPPTPPIAQTP